MVSLQFFWGAAAVWPRAAFYQEGGWEVGLRWEGQGEVMRWMAASKVGSGRQDLRGKCVLNGWGGGSLHWESWVGGGSGIIRVRLGRNQK